MFSLESLSLCMFVVLCVCVCVQWLLRQPEGKPFRAVVQANPSRIMNLATGPNKVSRDVLFIFSLFLVTCCNLSSSSPRENL